MSEKDRENDAVELTPEEKKKAERTIWLLYAIMIVMVVLPFLLFLRYGNR